MLRNESKTDYQGYSTETFMDEVGRRGILIWRDVRESGQAVRVEIGEIKWFVVCHKTEK